MVLGGSCIKHVVPLMYAIISVSAQGSSSTETNKDDESTNTAIDTIPHMFQRRTCNYDFMKDVIQFTSMTFHEGDPLVTGGLQECTYFNDDISCCNRREEEVLINIIKDTQLKVFQLKQETANDERRAKLIKGRFLAISERVAEKVYQDTPILATLDDSLSQLFLSAMEVQEAMSVTFKDPAFQACLDEISYTIQDFSCALCSPAVGDASSIPGNLFLKAGVCKGAFSRCHQGFAKLRELRSNLTAHYRDVRLAAMNARNEDTHAISTPQDTILAKKANQSASESEVELKKNPKDYMSDTAARRWLARQAIVEAAETDAYYAGIIDVLAPPHQKILRDEHYGEDTLENFCRHYMSSVSPMHIVNLLSLERTYAGDLVLLAEQEAQSAISAYDKARQTLASMLAAANSGITGKSSAFVQLSAVESTAVTSTTTVKAGSSSSTSTTTAKNTTTSTDTKAAAANGSSSSTSTTTAKSSAVVGADGNAEEDPKADAAAEAAKADEPVDIMALDSSFGLIYKISQDLTLQDKAVFAGGFSSLIDKLKAIPTGKEQQDSQQRTTASDEFFTREYYARSTPHIDSSGTPCTAGPKREVCFFPMDQTPFGTFEEIASGEYVVSSSTCASGEGDYGWCWTEAPISAEGFAKGKRRAFALCNQSCRNARAFFEDEPIPTNVKTPGGVTVYPVSVIQKDGDENEGGKDEGPVAAKEEAISVSSFEIGPNGEDMWMNNVFYETLAGPRIIVSEYGIEARSRSNHTDYNLTHGDEENKKEENNKEDKKSSSDSKV